MSIKRYILLVANILIFLSFYSHAQSSSFPAPLFAAGGLYYDINGTQFPMLAMNVPHRTIHNSWTYTIDSAHKLPYDFSSAGSFPGVICPDETCIAVGGYVDSLGNTYPMIAVGKDHFSRGWEYVIDKSFGVPNHYSQASFNSVACTEDTNTCVAVGEFQTKTSTNVYPLIAVSLKGGVKGTWKFIDTTSDFPGSDIDAYLNSVSCVGDTCTAGGQNVYNNNTQSDPILAVNTRVGLGSWDFITTLPGDFNNTGTANTFNSVTCLNSKYCIAGGQYFNGTNNYPMLAVNTNVHNSPWKYVIYSAGNTLPVECLSNPESCSGNIWASDCSDYHCAVAGTYTYEGNSFPMIAVNTNVLNPASSWVYEIDSTVLPTRYAEQGNFYDVKCTNNLCAASGEYVGAGLGSVEYPMLALSYLNESDGWHYEIDSRRTTLPHEYENAGSFYGINCDENDSCFTQGYYSAKDGNYYPMLAENNRVLSRGNWHYPIDSKGPFPKKFDGYGLFCGSVAPLVVCPNGDFKK